MVHQSTYSAIITFGKFKGNSLGYIADTNRSYLEWLSGADGIPDLWRVAAAKTLLGESVEQLNLPQVRQAKIDGKFTAAMVMVDAKTAAVKFPYNEAIINRIKAEVDGRKWDDKNMCWQFPAVHISKALNVFGGKENVRCSPEVLAELDSEINRRNDLDEIRKKTDTVLDIPELKLPLYDFQKVGVEFVLRSNGRAMIADEMGLGKTVQGIGYAVHKKRKTLIICPMSTVINWKREISKFTGLSATIWDSKHRIGETDNQFHIINYDSVAKQLKNLLKQNFQLLICDEVTQIKNRKTIRAKAILGSWKERTKYPGIKTEDIIFLTGTPIVNKPIEAYTLLNVLDKERFNNWYHFTQRYGGWITRQTQNLDELHQRTKDLIIRRLKKDVMPELPPKQRNDLYIDLSDDDRKEYDKLLNDLFSKWKFSGKPSVAEMPTIQRFLIDRKIPKLREMIDEYLEAGRSLIIFSCYVEPLKRLAKLYKNDSSILTGEMSKTARQETIDNLSSGKSKVGCISIKAGGMGIDGLQHAIDTVVFLDQDWTPAIHEQAEDRTHRAGQKKKVQVYYLVCADTIDEYMREILTQKQYVIDHITDGETISEARNRSIFKEFIAKLTKEYGDKFVA